MLKVKSEGVESTLEMFEGEPVDQNEASKAREEAYEDMLGFLGASQQETMAKIIKALETGDKAWLVAYMAIATEGLSMVFASTMLGDIISTEEGNEVDDDLAKILRDAGIQ